MCSTETEAYTKSWIFYLSMMLRDGRRVGKRFLSVGPLGIVVAVFLGSAFIAYIFSVLLTTVANAVLILSASPFLAAIMARTFLGERVSALSWGCMSAGLAGVAVMMADGLLDGTILGSTIALLAALGYSASNEKKPKPVKGLSGIYSLNTVAKHGVKDSLKIFPPLGI